MIWKGSARLPCCVHPVCSHRLCAWSPVFRAHNTTHQLRLYTEMHGPVLSAGLCLAKLLSELKWTEPNQSRARLACTGIMVQQSYASSEYQCVHVGR